MQYLLTHFQILIEQTPRTPRQQLVIVSPLIARYQRRRPIRIHAASIRSGPRPSERIYPPRHIRNEHLQHSVHRLLAHHNDHQLNAQLHQTTTRTAFFLPITEDPIVLGRITDEFALEEGHIEYGTVVVDELEEVDLQCETLVVFGLRATIFPGSKGHGQIVVGIVKDGDYGQIDAGRSGWQDDHRVGLGGFRVVETARVDERHAVDDDAEYSSNGQTNLEKIYIIFSNFFLINEKITKIYIHTLCT